jgi:hypothetical protein
MADLVIVACRGVSIMGAHMSKQEIKEDNKELLSAEELQVIRSEAEAEVDKELKTKERERIKKEFLQTARMLRGVTEPDDVVTIDLPEHADRIVINGVAFMHGRIYRVPAGVAMQLRETMQGAWQHQAVVEGRRKDFYTKRNTRMNGLTGAVTNSALLRA